VSWSDLRENGRKYLHHRLGEGCEKRLQCIARATHLSIMVATRAMKDQGPFAVSGNYTVAI